MKPYSFLSSAARGRAIEQRQLVTAMDHRRQVVLHQPRFLSWHETGQNENRLPHALLANRNSFVRTGDTEPVCPALLHRFPHFPAPAPATLPPHYAHTI